MEAGDQARPRVGFLLLGVPKVGPGPCPCPCPCSGCHWRSGWAWAAKRRARHPWGVLPKRTNVCTALSRKRTLPSLPCRCCFRFCLASLGIVEPLFPSKMKRAYCGNDGRASSNPEAVERSLGGDVYGAGRLLDNVYPWSPSCFGRYQVAVNSIGRNRLLYLLAWKCNSMQKFEYPNDYDGKDYR